MKGISITFFILLSTYSSASEQFEKKHESKAGFVDGGDLWRIEYNAINTNVTPGK